jgi:hypothetical protein
VTEIFTVGGLNVFKESHETEIHVEILMAVKQAEPGIVRDKIDINSTEAFHQNRRGCSPTLTL